MVWEGGDNLLGRGARIYLDSDFGDRGCNYGVHINTGWFYPCQSTWRVFNLQSSGALGEGGGTDGRFRGGRGGSGGGGVYSISCMAVVV